MKLKRSYKWRIALSASVLATVGFLPQVRAELVYEPEVSPNAPTQVRAEDREATRNALDASVKVQNAAAAQAAPAAPVAPMAQVVPAVVTAPVPPTVIVPVQAQAPVAAPVLVAAPAQEAPQTEVQSLSKTELMRRERTRTELKNEDILQERLEELRLRDEKRRTQQLIGDGTAATPDQSASTASITVLATPAQPQSQVVVSPVTDHPGQPAPEVVAPVPTAAQAQQYSAGTVSAPAAAMKSPYTVAAQDQMNASQATAISLAPSDDKKSGFYIAPRAGVSSMNVNSGFDVTGHFSLGVAGGMNISDNLAFEVGYTYSEYGVGYGNQITSMYATGTSFDAYTLKQNVIEADLKLFFLGPDSKIRPFITGGFGYAIGYLNYPSSVLSYYQSLGYSNLSQDYTSDSYLGTVGAGLDLKINKSITLGAQFKYYTVLSTTTNSLYYGASVAPGSALAYDSTDPTGKGPLGASLAQSSFYSMTAGLSFAF